MLDCPRALYGLTYAISATGSNSYGIGEGIIDLIPYQAGIRIDYSRVHSTGLPSD